MLRSATVLTAVSFVAALLGGAASGSTDEGPTDAEMPTFFFDWDDVAAAEVPPVVALAPRPDGTCAGRIQSVISIGPNESASKALTLAPLLLDHCTFEVRATSASLTAPVVGLHDEALFYASGAACGLGLDWCFQDAQNAPELGTPPVDSGEKDVSVVKCRIADGWAHTGVPDPPTVVYTRIYQEMQFCYDGQNAWIEDLRGLCFANPETRWRTVADECYFVDWEAGPASTVFLEIHGYFEKDANQPMVPFHDMWNTVNGKAGGGVYCTGDIEGEYDGYVTVDNCGATAPQSQD